MQKGRISQERPQLGVTLKAVEDDLLEQQPRYEVIHEVLLPLDVFRVLEVEHNAFCRACGHQHTMTVWGVPVRAATVEAMMIVGRPQKRWWAKVMPQDSR
ncbi:MAG: hypothetical protein ETSY1_09125 [Candidatus Entotheonella factor]|uniref:Uncharacterized protein n=1 Tax=Entotheonella factor TaxID=1429438 RepID=W4LTF7_ENTF1|nr:MAG: hypothetical protein ETSY1_09125 [Candidatus Entotheonella factor]